MDHSHRCPSHRVPQSLADCRAWGHLHHLRNIRVPTADALAAHLLLLLALNDEKRWHQAQAQKLCGLPAHNCGRRYNLINFTWLDLSRCATRPWLLPPCLQDPWDALACPHHNIRACYNRLAYLLDPDREAALAEQKAWARWCEKVEIHWPTRVPPYAARLGQRATSRILNAQLVCRELNWSHPQWWIEPIHVSQL